MSLNLLRSPEPPKKVATIFSFCLRARVEASLAAMGDAAKTVQ
jgi:hypothetical protein